MDKLFDKLEKELLFFDGAMGTVLQEKGLRPGEYPESWNFSHPEVIEEVHASYLAAGADVITANTFGANPIKLEREIALNSVREGVKLAKKAVLQAGKGMVALDIGPSGKLLKPLGDLDFEEAVSAFGAMTKTGAEAGADLVLIETMNDIYEAKAAILGAKENSCLPILVTMTFDQDGKLLTGGDLSVAAAVLEGLGVDGIGLNCGLGPEQMLSLLRKLRKLTRLPLLVSPNAGLPKERDGRTVYDVGPKEFAQIMKQIVLSGACAIGGCCGTTPTHMKETVQLCKGLPCPVPPDVSRTVVASGSRSVEFGKFPVIIGERINPTGKSRFKQALREKDVPYILKEGISQQEAGAHVLDVNVGLPEIDEPAMMCQVVRELQSITPLPLQIDTADPKTMEQAMRLYNGKPLVNSVTAKKASMEAVYPLVQKYGGVVIGLTITEDGIPETPEGRLEAAKIIVDTAAKYGIGKENLVIDPLTMAVSAEGNAAQVTLKALKLIREELGVFTSLGVSNVSFGLPQRENITSAFLLMALENGLSAAILNPKSEKMRQAYLSYGVLSGLDTNCASYIEQCSQAAEPADSTPRKEYSLGEAVEKGMKDDAAKAAEKAVQHMSGLDLIDREIIPALDAVGKRFEEKSLFLPQLLMSAEAAKAAFEVVKSHLRGQASQQSKLTVVIATVKGDIHDIGKNIVKVLLENYGFRVIDLGKDVSPEAVVEAAQREQAGLVGLSALMTTTVPNMKATISLLREKNVNCKVMVGGAVLTQEYADMIGADFYGRDAMASVRYATEIANGLR